MFSFACLSGPSVILFTAAQAAMSSGKVFTLFFFYLMASGHWLISGATDDIQSFSLSLNVTLQPKEGVRMMVGQSATVNVSFQFNELQNFNDSFFVFWRIEDSAVADFNGSSNYSIAAPLSSSSSSVSPESRYIVSVQLTGRQVGITAMTVSLGPSEALGPPRAQRRAIASEYSVRVTKTASPLNRGLRLGAMGAMALNFMTFGCKLRYGDLKKYAKQPFGIFIGFLFQYGIMPTVRTQHLRSDNISIHSDNNEIMTMSFEILN